MHLDVLRRQTTEFREPGIWLILAIFFRGIPEIIAFVLLDGDLIADDRAEGAVEAELAGDLRGHARSAAPRSRPESR